MPSETQKRSRESTPLSFLPPDDVLFGRSGSMAGVRQRAEKIRGASVPVLLEGEGGTGKEALARWIHQHSPWCDGQFVKVSCAAIPGGLLESELFGYEKGAFSGAVESKPGRVELADKGTLFLDEIADLEAGLQSKLLHFLQDGRFSRIGEGAERAVDTRLMCATNKDLEQEIEAGKFRADLYYRINVVRLKLPSLRERREDIPVLADYFLQQFQQQFGKKADPLSEELTRYLQNLEWPGNIRELSNTIIRHVLLGPDAKLAQERLTKLAPAPPANSQATVTVPLKQLAKKVIRERERNYILEALQANRWNRRKTAKALQISYRALIYKIRDAGLRFKDSN